LGAYTTAVDAAPEALQINRNQIRAPNVEYRETDLFSWQPNKRFEVVFFSFWLSHIPPQRFATFWQMVRRALTPDGCVFFIDSLFEEASTARDHVAIDRTGFARRKLNDGREFRIVKVFYEPAIIEERLLTEGTRMGAFDGQVLFLWLHEELAGQSTLAWLSLRTRVGATCRLSCFRCQLMMLMFINSDSEAD
jgi:Methyltransferase domain